MWERQAAQKQTLAEAKYQFSPVERNFDDLLEKKLKKAKENRKTSTSSNVQKINEIKANKRQLREQERKELAIKPNRPKQNEVAAVIPLKGEEENYQLPDFIPELFDEDDN